MLISPQISRIVSSSYVAVDGNSWVYQCMRQIYGQIIKKDPQAIRKLVKRFMERVKELQSYDIVPYIVFDGAKLPNKKIRSDGRKSDRVTNLAKARQATDPADEQKYYTKATVVTHQEVYAVIQALKQDNIKYIVAPYEADPQLAYLCLNDYVDAVLTSDADLIAYGCKKVIFRFPTENIYKLYNASKLECSKSFAGFTQTMVLQTSILGGCDYLSIPGVGIAGAVKAMKEHKREMIDDEDYFKVIKKAGATDAENFNKYTHLLRNVMKTFQHQRVYNPEDKSVVHLTYMPNETEEDYIYVGPPIDRELAEYIAMGDIDPSTKKKMQPLLELSSWRDEELENHLVMGQQDKRSPLMDYQQKIIEMAECQFGIVSDDIKEETRLLKVLCPIIGDASRKLGKQMHKYCQTRDKVIKEKEEYSAKLCKVVIEPLKDMLEAESEDQEFTLDVYKNMTKLKRLHYKNLANVLGCNWPTDRNEALEIITYGSPEESVDGVKVVCQEFEAISKDPGAAHDKSKLRKVSKTSNASDTKGRRWHFTGTDTVKVLQLETGSPDQA